jgi:hypothetical protein
VPLGFALVLAGVQTGIRRRAIAARVPLVADWFLALGSRGAHLGHRCGSRAPVRLPTFATNALILVAAWAVLVVSPAPTSFARAPHPFVIALAPAR